MQYKSVKIEQSSSDGLIQMYENDGLFKSVLSATAIKPRRLTLTNKPAANKLVHCSNIDTITSNRIDQPGGYDIVAKQRLLFDASVLKIMTEVSLNSLNILTNFK